jgi:TRADD-N domain-containing protein
MNDNKTEHSEHSVPGLETARDALKRRREHLENFRTAMLVLAVVCLSGSLVIPFFLYIYNPQWATLAVVAGLGHSAILFAFVLVAGARVEHLAEQIQDLDFDIDLERYRSGDRETRAEKLLRINTTQLRRYYDLNLQQNHWMFGLGIGCISLGVVMISSTVILIVIHPMPPDEKIIAAVLGGIGSFLTNFVAVMYLKMNSTAAQSLTAFHAQLVKTHDLLMSNLLISSINNDEKRWATLSELSLRIVDERKLSQGKYAVQSGVKSRHAREESSERGR